MRARDFEIHDYQKLDQILVQLCGLVIARQKHQADHYGMVSAAVLDPDNNIVARTSTRTGRLWRHAERNAMDAYQSEYGEIPAGCIVITTLSPCSRSHDTTSHARFEESCTDLINSSPVRKVYSGLDDPTQPQSQRQFDQMETSNPKIRSLCRAFADTFLDPVTENFADGRHPERKGDSKRYGIPKHSSLAALDKIGHGGGRKAQLARWQANMRRGHKK